MTALTNPNIMVTGSGGLLGGELIKQLLQNDQAFVIAMTSQVTSLKARFSADKLKVVSNDSWETELKNSGVEVDTLINCSFPRSSNTKELASGIPFTEQLIKDSINFGIENIINISSQSVYTQKQKKDVTESSEVQPESLYGMTKYACERIVSLLSEQHDINYTNIRLGSLAGINFDARMTNRFVKSAILGEKITIIGGKQSVSYLDVRDAAKGLIKMINKEPRDWNPIYNFGNEEFFTLIELVDKIKEEARRYDIRNIEVEIQEGDSDFNNVMNNNLFYKQFSFQPYYNLSKMISELFTYQLRK